MAAPKKTTTKPAKTAACCKSSDVAKEKTPIKEKETFKEKETTAVKQIIFPTLKEYIPMTEEERTLFNVIKSSKVIAGENVTPLFEMYNRLFLQKKKRCMCGAVIKNMIDTITKYHYQ